MDERKMLEIVEQYSRESYPADEAIKIKRVPDQKTVFIEQIAEDGRAIVLNEYKVDGNLLGRLQPAQPDGLREPGQKLT